MTSLGLWPATIVPRNCRFTLTVNQRVSASPFGGGEQVVDMLNDRLLCALTLPVNRFSVAAAVEAFLFSFRGQINTVNLWHFARPAPLGTMRGAPTVAAAALQGAALIQVQTTAGATLLAGDMIQAAQLLLMVQTNCIADGTGLLTVPLVNRLRTAVALGAAVVWDKPVAPFRLLNHSGIEYGQGLAGEVTLSLGEAIGL
jgi:hypothetical protein